MSCRSASKVGLCVRPTTIGSGYPGRSGLRSGRGSKTRRIGGRATKLSDAAVNTGTFSDDDVQALKEIGMGAGVEKAGALAFQGVTTKTGMDDKEMWAKAIELVKAEVTGTGNHNWKTCLHCVL